MPPCWQRTRSLPRPEKSQSGDDGAAHRQAQYLQNFGAGRRRKEAGTAAGRTLISRPPKGSSHRRWLKRSGASRRPLWGGWGRSATNKQGPVYTSPLLAATTAPTPYHQLFRSISASIRATSSLGRISSALAIFQSVSKFACLSPFSIIVR